MSLRYKGGVISATPPTTTGGTSGTAKGVWTLEQQLQAQAANLWPVPTPPLGQDMRSLRFNSADSASLTRTFPSAGNRKTWTWSGWLKRTALSDTYGGALFICSSGSSDSTYSVLWFYANAIRFQAYNTLWRVTSAVYRDLSAWYHVVLALDTTQATANNRIKLYVNGSQVTDFSTTNNPNQNDDLYINSANLHRIGEGDSFYSNMYLTEVVFVDGQALTPSSFGQTNSTTGVWEPKTITGLTYGTNGFYLNFQDNSGATATTLGKDSSGNGNNWTPNNFSVVGNVAAGSVNISTVASSGWVAGGTPVDMVDGNAGTIYNALNGGISFSTPISGSFSVQHGRGAGGLCWNEFYDSSNNLIYQSPSVNLTAGQSQVLGPYVVANVAKIIGNSNATGNGSDGHGIGPFYINGAEVNTNSTGPTSFSYPAYSAVGDDSMVDTPYPYGTDTGAGGEVRGNYCTWNPIASLGTNNTLSNGNLYATGGGYSVGTIYNSSGKWYFEETVAANASDPWVGFGVDGVDTSKLRIYRGNGQYFNGSSWAAYGASYTNGDVISVALDLDNNTITFYKNGASQGQKTSINLSGTLVAPIYYSAGPDAGNFNFGQRPFAYTAPSGFKALCTQNLPTPTVVQGDDYFNPVLYTGNGTSQSITGLDFSPDLVWTKSRSNAYNNTLVDSVRGVSKALVSDLTAVEDDSPGSYVTAFNSNGFSVGTGTGSNGNGATYVGWAWRASDSAPVSNTQGALTGTVSANATAGFSIVTWAASGTYPNTTLGHGLGATPGFIITKSRNNNNSWRIWHKNMSASNNERYYLGFDQNGVGDFGSNYWVTPTSTLFGGQSSGYDNNVGNMVAYVFASVAGFSDFGKYTGNGSADGPFVYLGFRPAYVMVKCVSAGSTNWIMLDNKRNTYNVENLLLRANLSDAEVTITYFDALSNGFKIRTTDAGANTNSATYIYAAFAENPFKYALAR